MIRGGSRHIPHVQPFGDLLIHSLINLPPENGRHQTPGAKVQVRAACINRFSLIVFKSPEGTGLTHRTGG